MRILFPMSIVLVTLLVAASCGNKQNESQTTQPETGKKYCSAVIVDNKIYNVEMTTLNNGGQAIELRLNTPDSIAGSQFEQAIAISDHEGKNFKVVEVSPRNGTPPPPKFFQDIKQVLIEKNLTK